ncbi:OFA family MFS transporter [Vibrio sp.]|uniref:OFA family MFS transporter n=1 Tax=Vibrio sp. TaxID=678 RepID=UPI003AA81D27
MSPTHPHLNTRLWTLAGTMLTLFSLGSIYTWSLFNAPLSTRLDTSVEHVAFCFGILSLCLAFASLLSSKLQTLFGVRKVTIAVGLMLGISLVLIPHVTHLWMLYITAGLFVGCAVGIGYLMSLSNCVKLFPEHKGLVSACAIGAYGLGSLGFKYINLYLLTHSTLTITFDVWGGLVAGLILIAGLMMHDAPTQKQSSQDTGAQSVVKQNSRDFSLAEAMKLSQFWMLAFVFLTLCMSGLYIIGVAQDLGHRYVHLSVSAAASAVAVIALANLSGRFMLGILSDKFARILVVNLAVLICLAGVLALRFFELNALNFYIAVACVAFSFGGAITVFPSLVSDFFGLNNLTKNYGAIYLGYGIGSLAGSVIASLFGGFIAVFAVMLVLLVVSSVICCVIKKPSDDSAQDAHELTA